MEKKMKKRIAFAIVSLLAYLNGSPVAKAGTEESALNPMGKNRGMEDGVQMADCAFNDNAENIGLINSLRNAMNLY